MQAIARPIARVAPRQVRAAAALSTWANVPAGPPDPILGEYSRRRVDMYTPVPAILGCSSSSAEDRPLRFTVTFTIELNS